MGGAPEHPQQQWHSGGMWVSSSASAPGAKLTGSESSHLRHVKVVLHSQWDQGVQASVRGGWSMCESCSMVPWFGQS